MIISLDTETTGLDLAHDAMPFIITTCDEKGVNRFCEWNVNPLTREPEVHEEDVSFFKELIDNADLIYLHNSQFDCRALAKIGIELPWHKVRDSLAAAHLLGSNLKHNLTDSVEMYLGRKIEQYELDMKEVVKECRNIVKRQYPNWKIAREGDEDMPSIKVSSKRDEDKPWKNDMWLPRALAMQLGLSALDENCTHEFHNKSCIHCGGHFWFAACARYANADSIHTLPLGLEMERLIRDRGYWKHYEHRLEVMQAACEMVSTGVTVIGDYTRDTIQQYTEFSCEAASALSDIACNYDHELELASGAALNDNMREFFYGSVQQHCLVCDHVKRVKHWNGEHYSAHDSCPKCLKGTKRKPSRHSAMRIYERPNLGLPIIENKKSGNASLDKDAMQQYLATLEGEPYEFIKLLMDKRKHDTDLSYMQAYTRFWVPCEGAPGYYRIHSSLNPFGTDHVRWSNNSPNLQNVGGQEDKCDECEGIGCSICHGTGKSRVSVKNCFGPAPGREWYSADYKQIERRIPPYECGEEKMIEVFENPNEPPYWGSLYLLTASVLYPDQYWPAANDDGRFRKEYPRLYKQSKFFDLAKQYACGRAKGDLLSKVSNSFDLINGEFPKLAALQKHYVDVASRTGFVTTLPSKAINPEMGYPILASRTEDNYILPTTPFNYHTSGTACECLNLALVRCRKKCAEWRESGFDARLPLEIHDEIIFDFPKGPQWDSNLWRAMQLKTLMEQSGEDLVPRIPTPVKLEYHSRTWAEGVAV